MIVFLEEPISLAGTGCKACFRLLQRAPAEEDLDLQVKVFPAMKNQGSDGFMGEEYLTFEEEIIQFMYRFFQKIKEVML